MYLLVHVYAVEDLRFLYVNNFLRLQWQNRPVWTVLVSPHADIQNTLELHFHAGIPLKDSEAHTAVCVTQ